MSLDGRQTAHVAQIPRLEDWHVIHTRGLIQQRSVRHDSELTRSNFVRPRDTKATQLRLVCLLVVDNTEAPLAPGNACHAAYVLRTQDA